MNEKGKLKQTNETKDTKLNPFPAWPPLLHVSHLNASRALNGAIHVSLESGGTM